MNTEQLNLNRELDLLASNVQMKKGTFLFRCGDPVSGVFLIRTGSVKLWLDGADTIYPARLATPGELVGLPATLTGSYSLSAEVAEDAEVGFIPARRVTELFEVSPQLCLQAMRLIGEEIARTRTLLRDSVPLAVSD